MCIVLCMFFMNTAPDVYGVVQVLYESAPDVYAVVHVLYEYSPWCVWCCAGSIWIQPLMCLVLCRFYMNTVPDVSIVLCRFYMNTAPDVFGVVQVLYEYSSWCAYGVVQILYEYSPWCDWCCAGSMLDIIKAKMRTGNCTMRVNLRNYGLAIDSAYCLTSRLKILISPAGQCFHSPVSSEWKSRSYVGYPPWHTVAEPGVTVSPPWTRLMPGLQWCLTVERRIIKSYGDVQEYAGVASPTQCVPIIKNHF